jgi:hypothetical protein
MQFYGNIISVTGEKDLPVSCAGKSKPNHGVFPLQITPCLLRTQNVLAFMSRNFILITPEFCSVLFFTAGRHFD